MESLARLVSESMARHGVDYPVDYRRLHWSRWFRCETSFDLLLVPSRPGLFAIAEEVLAPGDATAGGKRMLAVLQLCDSSDLAIAMSRLLAPTHLLKDRVAGGRIFVRYTVIQDDAQRKSAHLVFQRWLTSSAEAASGITNDFGDVAALLSLSTKTDAESCRASVHSPAPLPSGF